ncbi:MAG: hypothetical protein JWR08_2641 [Enterovirga sp.]|nr:hypothetical protein [Enterovirga sp.]
MLTVLLVGSSGLVGREVLAQVLADPRFGRAVALTRSPLSRHPRLINPVVDFDQLPADASWWGVDGVICTLGTTLGKAGSPEAFRRVDLDYPREVARLARRHGATRFALNSALGAAPSSRFLYLRTKGSWRKSWENSASPP